MLQLIGGGESTKRLIASDPYSDEDILGNASDAMPRARQDYHESTAQETTTKRETILTSDSIRTMGLTENFVRFDDKMPQTNSKQGYLKMSTLGPLDDVSAYKFQKSILSPSLHSPVAAPLTLPRSDYRWRTGKDPLHQRSGDGISRGFNVAIISKPLGDLPVLSKLKLQQNESVCSRVLTRISGGFLSLPGCTGWKWTFGRQEIESLIDTCRHYCKSGKSVASKYFCWGKFESISKSSSNSEKFSANYACSTYEIYSTSLFLPSLCTVLFPIEMMQDFSDSWVYMCDFFWNMPLLISRCSSTKRGEQ